LSIVGLSDRDTHICICPLPRPHLTAMPSPSSTSSSASSCLSHPLQVLMDFAGKEATQAFYEQHRVDVLKKYDHFKIGQIAGAKVCVHAFVCLFSFKAFLSFFLSFSLSFSLFLFFSFSPFLFRDTRPQSHNHHSTELGSSYALPSPSHSLFRSASSDFSSGVSSPCSSSHRWVLNGLSLAPCPRYAIGSSQALTPFVFPFLVLCLPLLLSFSESVCVPHSIPPFSYSLLHLIAISACSVFVSVSVSEDLHVDKYASVRARSFFSIPDS
jgi:hypothetical protein